MITFSFFLFDFLIFFRFLCTYVHTYRDHMRRVLKLPSFITIEYKKHEDSLLDKSSYRNPSVVWRAPATTGRQGGTLRLYLHLSILQINVCICVCLYMCVLDRHTHTRTKTLAIYLRISIIIFTLSHVCVSGRQQSTVQLHLSISPT